MSKLPSIPGKIYATAGTSRKRTGPKIDVLKTLTRQASKVSAKILRPLPTSYEKSFLVRCLLCREVREEKYISTRGSLRKCVCCLKTPNRRNKRTIPTHTDELKNIGHTEYKCLRLPSKTNKGRYQHLTCRTKFLSSFCNLKGSKTPCPKCRCLGFTQAQYESRLPRGVKCVGQYKGFSSLLLHEYACGHLVKQRPETVTNSLTAVCPKCNPNLFWHCHKVRGKTFKVRSKLEAAFLDYLCYEQRVPVDKIEYEPKSRRIRYQDPYTDRTRSYTPDFKVGRITVEVKDETSLGLKPPPPNWKTTQKRILLENQVKFRRSLDELEEFRVYLVKGRNFKRLHLSDYLPKHKDTQ
jgi:hypothetical protein